MAVKAGGDEVLHTVMEIRANPYDDMDEDAGAIAAAGAAA